MYSIRYSIGYRVFNEVQYIHHLTLSTPFAPSISHPLSIHLLGLAPSPASTPPLHSLAPLYIPYIYLIKYTIEYENT